MRIKNDNKMGSGQILLIPTLFYLFKIILIFIPLKKLNEMDGVYRILQSYPFVRNVYIRVSNGRAGPGRAMEKC